MENVAREPGIRGMLKGAGIGRIAYKTWYAPRAFISEVRRQGPLNKYLMHRGMKSMEAKTPALPPLPFCLSPEAALAPEVHFLTGRKYWYQTAYCAYTMASCSGLAFKPVVYDDGTLEQGQLRQLQRLFPHMIYYSRAEIDARIERVLPQRLFPALRERRINYPHIRKLTDVHAGVEGWRLVLDSDMLFFQNPRFLINYLLDPKRPCHMVDVANSYGYPNETMQELCEAPIPDRVNVGILGLKSEQIDWTILERWTHELLGRHGSSYLQEQALSAMLLAGRTVLRIPDQDYVCMPSEPEASSPTTILHHYVADSKSAYFRTTWKLAHKK